MFEIDMTPPSTATSPAHVPDGTSATSRNLIDLVEAYRGFGKQTVESYIEQCSILVEAKQRLEAPELDQFCAEIGLDPKGSTFRKAHKIGEVATRFTPYLDRLPNSWTSLYQLAKLDAAQFDQLVASGAVNPNMTAKDIPAPARTSKPRKAPKRFVLDLSKLNEVECNAVLEAILKLRESYAFELNEATAMAGGDE